MSRAAKLLRRECTYESDRLTPSLRRPAQETALAGVVDDFSDSLPKRADRLRGAHPLRSVYTVTGIDVTEELRGALRRLTRAEIGLLLRRCRRAHVCDSCVYVGENYGSIKRAAGESGHRGDLYVCIAELVTPGDIQRESNTTNMVAKPPQHTSFYSSHHIFLQTTPLSYITISTSIFPRYSTDTA
ncbi:hypothetical protein EVAR_52263_1 [Eumeta japonica]|uniref:Uncharacterized protein n=1 Tax=Eumeta variegata TaxID=151549 RepID=A0A4C1YQN4_EUMVA|nr:hypothetical protein EVAR_52263_1 [Eumeta japonica]